MVLNPKAEPLTQASDAEHRGIRTIGLSLYDWKYFL